MARQPGFFDLDSRLRELSAKGDDLERISALVDFEVFRRDLVQAVPRSDGKKGGRPAFDPVLMFKILLPHIDVTCLPIRLLPTPTKWPVRLNGTVHYTRTAGRRFEGLWR